MSKAGKKVFEIDDLRREIFSYLRTRKSALICNYCDNVVKWDKKVKDYVIVNDNNFSSSIITHAETTGPTKHPLATSSTPKVI